MSQNGEKTPRVRIPRRNAPAKSATPETDRPEQQEEDWIARFRATHYADGQLPDQALAETPPEHQAGSAAPAAFPQPTQVATPADSGSISFARVGEPAAAQPWHLRFQDRAEPLVPAVTLPSLFDWGSLVVAPAAPAALSAPGAIPDAVEEPSAPVAEIPQTEPAASAEPILRPEAAQAEATLVSPTELTTTTDGAEPAAWETQPASAHYDWGLGDDLGEQPSGPARPSWMNDTPLTDQALSDADWMARFSDAASQPAPAAPQPEPAAFAEPQPADPAALSDQEWMTRFGNAAAAPAPTSSPATAQTSKPAASGGAISDAEWMARFGGGQTILPPEAAADLPPAKPATPAPRQIEAPRMIVPAAPPAGSAGPPNLYLDWDAIAKDSENEQQREAEQRAAEQKQRAAEEQQREAQRVAAEQAEATARRRRRRTQQEDEDGEWIAKLRSERFDAEADHQTARSQSTSQSLRRPLRAHLADVIRPVAETKSRTTAALLRPH